MITGTQFLSAEFLTRILRAKKNRAEWLMDRRVPRQWTQDERAGEALMRNLFPPQADESAEFARPSNLKGWHSPNLQTAALRRDPGVEPVAAAGQFVNLIGTDRSVLFGFPAPHG